VTPRATGSKAGTGTVSRADRVTACLSLNQAAGQCTTLCEATDPASAAPVRPAALATDLTRITGPLVLLAERLTRQPSTDPASLHEQLAEAILTVAASAVSPVRKDREIRLLLTRLVALGPAEVGAVLAIGAPIAPLTDRDRRLLAALSASGVPLTRKELWVRVSSVNRATVDTGIADLTSRGLIARFDHYKPSTYTITALGTEALAAQRSTP